MRGENDIRICESKYVCAQAKDGNSLEAQSQELQRAGAEEIFSEAFAGTVTERPRARPAYGADAIWRYYRCDEAGQNCSKSETGY